MKATQAFHLKSGILKPRPVHKYSQKVTLLSAAACTATHISHGIIVRRTSLVTDVRCEKLIDCILRGVLVHVP